MATRLGALLDGMRELESQMERQLSVPHHEWGYRFEKKRVHFEHETRQHQHQLRQSIPRFESSPFLVETLRGS